MSEAIPQEQLRAARETLRCLQANMSRFIHGKDEVIAHVLTCLIAPGHILIEDLPGVGKTTLAYCLAKSLDCSFRRIQFTTDLLPGDVTGVSIFDERVRDFVFKPGPVFANIVLADEINRATPKTQSSLLEVMDRGKVSVDGKTEVAGSPFMVFATQNPVDFEGTFPLPESQMDRFLMRLSVGYPSFDEERRILRREHQGYDDLPLQSVATGAEVLELQKLVPKVYLEDSVLEYLLHIITATRTESEFKAGVSVRGTLALKSACQARALLHGRGYVIPDDVDTLLPVVLVHRLTLRRPSSDVLEERRVIQSNLKKILSLIPSPV